MHCGDLSVALSLSRLGSLPWPHCYMWAHSCGLTSACRAHCRGRTAMAHCGGLTAVVSWWSKGTHPQPTKHPQPSALQPQPPQAQNKFSHCHALTLSLPLAHCRGKALEGQGSTPLCVGIAVAHCNELSPAPPSPPISEQAVLIPSPQEPTSHPPLRTAFHVGTSAWHHAASKDRHCRQPASLLQRDPMSTCALSRAHECLAC